MRKQVRKTRRWRRVKIWLKKGENQVTNKEKKN